MTGGHGATDSLGTFQDGIGIFLRKLNDTEINIADNTARIGGGVSTFEVSHALWKRGKETGSTLNCSDRANAN